MQYTPVRIKLFLKPTAHNKWKPLLHGKGLLLYCSENLVALIFAWTVWKAISVYPASQKEPIWLDNEDVGVVVNAQELCIKCARIVHKEHKIQAYKENTVKTNCCTRPLHNGQLVSKLTALPAWRIYFVFICQQKDMFTSTWCVHVCSLHFFIMHWQNTKLELYSIRDWHGCWFDRVFILFVWYLCQ